MASIHRNERKSGPTFTLKWRDPDSERAMDTLTFATLGEAELWKRLLDANGQSFSTAERTYEDQAHTGPTVTELLLEHVSQLTDVTEYTDKRYRGSIRLYFSARLGSTKASAVKHRDIVEWIKWMQEQGRGPKTISNAHGLLSAGMETAVRRGYRPSNPCKGVRLPKAATVGDDATMITQTDFLAIEAHLPAHFKPFFWFLVGTGLRFSEATALTAADFDLDVEVPTVRVNKAHKLAADGGRYVGAPKTRKGRRTVSMASSTVAWVRPLVESAGDGLVFLMPQGGQMTAQAVFNRAWKPARDAAKLNKRVTIHGLRHLHAATLLAAGMDMYDLSRRLGHANIAMTVDVYSHLLPDAKFNAARFATKALEGF